MARKIHRYVPFVLSLVLVSAVVAGCGGSSASSSTTTTIGAFVDPACASTYVPGGAVTLSTDLGDTDARVAAMKCVIAVSARALSGKTLSATVVAGSTIDALAPLLVKADPGITASDVAGDVGRYETIVYTDPYNIAVNLTKIGTDAADAPSLAWLLSNDIAHDIFHTVQWTILGGGTVATSKKMDAEPAWLTEVAAQWFTDQLLESNGFATENAAAKAAVAQRAAYFPGLAKWETYEGLGSWNVPGTKLPTAVRFEALPEIGRLLADHAGDDALLYDYWTKRSATTEPWQTTFKSVFGVSAEDFYAAVAQHFADVAKTAPSTTAAN